MPIYEYQCKACGHQLEALQKFSDDPLRVCPMCSQEELTKLISAAGFQLKGSGWYMTDYKDKGKKPAADSAKSDKSEASAEKSETKTQTETKKTTDSGTNNSSNNSAAG